MRYPLLSRIRRPGDVKKLLPEELPVLCDEIRSFLIESVSATGGHLSSNLGVVELTVALHRALRLPQDKIVFDVGHQCYTHKLLTGRRAGFAQLRQKDGISGFPNPAESDCDAFIAGHGSTALSVAIGIARAKKIKGEPGKVVAIIGDGAFTGGMVYEGMNNIGMLNNLIVILNDNKMSISKNVGEIANYLTRLRTDPKYFHAKAQMETALESIPVVGAGMVRVLQGGKQIIRRGIYHSTMFEEMGFQYVGPVDGHDVLQLSQMFTNLQEQAAPLFIHVVTKKGKGFKPAEENPGEFHGVSAFDMNHITNPEVSPKDSFSTCFGSKLSELGKDCRELCAITAAMKYGTGLQYFKHDHPDRFFDVGMAEQHAVTFAAGLASQGLLPTVAIYSTFFQRAYDQMIHDVCLMRLNVLFAVDRAGLVPNDGETHQGIYDPAFFSEMRVETYSPANYAELEYWLTRLVRHPNGPRAIRYPRGEEKPSLAALGCSGEQFDFIDRQEGADTVLVSYGAEAEEALAACDLLLQKGVRADCCKLVRIVPLPEGICKALAGYKTILFAEECVRDGGIGQQFCFALQQSGWRGTFLLHAVDNRHLLHANVPQLRKDQALDAAALADSVLNDLTKEHGMKLRLDQYLCQNGLVQSRERAKALIMSGIVFINGQKADKAGEPVPEGAVVEVRGHDIGYVSRGGLKLEKAMQVFPMHPDGKVCMDIGASTGGFTDCMLQNGAVKVYAVDVGYGQLAWSLRTDSRVVNMERTNIRNVTPDMLAEPIEFFSVDVSFISLKHIFPVADAVCTPGACGVCLVKPQFEAGREKVGKKGVVREPATHREVLRAAIGYAEASHFSALGLDFSPIKGPEGNIEFLLFVRHGDFSPRLPEDAVDRVVEAAHAALDKAPSGH